MPQSHESAFVPESPLSDERTRLHYDTSDRRAQRRDVSRRACLDLPAPASQTHFMAHTYLLFDFGTDEEKAQQARHKLEGWKQAFRLDKKLQYKVEREEPEAAGAADEPADSPKSSSASKPKSAKSKSKSAPSKKSADAATQEGDQKSSNSNGQVHLLVRLYFSGHEKLTEQRWLDRIPAEEPFKDAAPRVVRQGQPQFDDVVSQFDSLE